MCFRNYFCSLKNFISCADTISFLNGCKSSNERYDCNEMKTHKRYCIVCGKSYTASLSIQIYCCHGCAKLSRKYSAGSPHDIEINTPKPEYRLDSSKVMDNLTCAHCGKVFQSSKVTTQYCSSECAKKERIQTEHDINRLITTIPS